MIGIAPDAWKGIAWIVRVPARLRVFRRLCVERADSGATRAMQVVLGQLHPVRRPVVEVSLFVDPLNEDAYRRLVLYAAACSRGPRLLCPCRSEAGACRLHGSLRPISHPHHLGKACAADDHCCEENGERGTVFARHGITPFAGSNRRRIRRPQGPGRFPGAAACRQSPCEPAG